MTANEQLLVQSFQFDPAGAAELREHWLRLLELGVFGDLKSAEPDPLPAVRRHALEIGEGLRALLSGAAETLYADERVKAALAASLSLREALSGLERAVKAIEDGADLARLDAELSALRQGLLLLLERHEALWAQWVKGRGVKGRDEGLEHAGAEHEHGGC